MTRGMTNFPCRTNLPRKLDEIRLRLDYSVIWTSFVIGCFVIGHCRRRSAESRSLIGNHLGALGQTTGGRLTAYAWGLAAPTRSAGGPADRSRLALFGAAVE